MAELSDTLRRLAERGTPVGPTAVYRRAARAAQAAGGSPDPPSPAHRFRARPALLAAACVLVLVGALFAYGSGDGGKRKVLVGAGGGSRSTAGTPRPGGEVVYGLENETVAGWCLPSAQLSHSGIEVASAIYDTLTVPTQKRDGTIGYVPYLARSVTHNAAYTAWSITLRAGVRFHNGQPLNAAAVKQNLDAYRAAPLFGIVLDDITDVQVVDDLTVRVVTARPWVAFDAFLWSDGRLGIAAPEQLADPVTCSKRPIGTGPFRFVRWTPNESLVVQRNPSYWQRDPAGRRLPYLDRIVFRPIPDAAARVTAVADGSVDLVDTSDPECIAQLRKVAAARSVQLNESDFGGPVTFLMLNVSRPPFNNTTARLALAHAIDFAKIIESTQAVAVRRAVQPFSSDNIAYVDPNRLNYPAYDPQQARTLTQQYERVSGGALRFTFLITDDPSSTKVAQLIQRQAAAVGISVDVKPLASVALTNAAIAGQYGAALWRNHSGGDPDTQRVWWESAARNGGFNAANFGKIHDPELDRLLTAGRSETDPGRRAELYQAVTRRFALEVYDLWGWYTRSASASVRRLEGLQPPRLPAGDEAVSIAGYQPVVGLWKDR